MLYEARQRRHCIGTSRHSVRSRLVMLNKSLLEERLVKKSLFVVIKQTVKGQGLAACLKRLFATREEAQNS